MRIVLDTNILVRAAGNDQGLAGQLLGEIISGPHTLVISPYILSEIARVLSYPRLQARWQLSQMAIAEFIKSMGDVAEIVLTTTPDPVVVADPDDDPMWSTRNLHAVFRSLRVYRQALLRYVRR